MRILDYQKKPNPRHYGQKKKTRLWDRFGGSTVGTATMPAGTSREDMPLIGPPRMPETPRRQTGQSKRNFENQFEQGDQFLSLPGMFSAVGIPDRVGDQQRRRWQQEMDIRESGVGRDGGVSIDDTPARIPNPRAKPRWGNREDNLSYPSDNPRARRGKKGSRWD